MRYRGIDIGRIDKVQLAPDLGGVDVALSLDQSAEFMARRSSRFWIVHPKIGSGGLKGLDTILGARYISAEPGPSNSSPTFHFQGLESAPIPVPAGSLELVLEASERGSVGRGSPVTWRRFQVGQVLSVGLSSDARRVLIRIAIEPEYTSLVLANSRFFETSGFDFDFGLDGFNLEMESIQTLFSGGIGLVTPEDPAPLAVTGQRFDLAPKPKDEWLEWEPALAAGAMISNATFGLPHPGRAQLNFETGLFNRDQTRHAWTLWTDAGLLGPSDVLHTPENADDEAQLQVSGISLATNPSTNSAAVSLLANTKPPAGTPALWLTKNTRLASQPEDCLAIGDPALATLALDAATLGTGPLPWELDPSLPIDETWHGAPVVSRSDGRLIGILIVNDAPIIAPLPRQIID